MTVWDITAKDLYLLLRDRRTFAILLILPLAFITIIGLTTGKLLGWRNANQTLKIAVVDETDYEAIGSAEFMKPLNDEDGGEAAAAMPAGDREAERKVARHVVADVLNRIQKHEGVSIRPVDDWRKELGYPAGKNAEETARQMTADEKVNATLIFKPDFYRRVYHARSEDLVGGDNESADEQFERIGLELVHSVPRSSTASAVAALVGIDVQRTLTPFVICRSGDSTIAERGSPRYRRLCGPVNEMSTEEVPKLLPPQKQTGGQASDPTYDRLVPSYTTMFVFFLINLMARSFLSEREIGTLRRLKVAPVGRWSVLFGKTLPFLVISLMQTAVLFVAGKLLFGMTWGVHPWMLLPVIFATSCAATGLGLLIATLVTSEAQVSAYANTAVIILAGISGCFMPRQFLPEAMQQLSLATPHAWALMAYDQLLTKARPDLMQVWRDVGMLLAFAAGFMLLGGWRFRSVD